MCNLTYFPRGIRELDLIGIHNGFMQPLIEADMMHKCKVLFAPKGMCYMLTCFLALFYTQELRINCF